MRPISDFIKQCMFAVCFGLSLSRFSDKDSFWFLILLAIAGNILYAKMDKICGEA
jgi:hypothetical protein